MTLLPTRRTLASFLVPSLILAMPCRGLAEPPDPEKLVEAALDGDIDGVKDLIEQGADLDAAPPPGATAWQVARLRGYHEIAELLESKGARTDLPMPAPEAVADWHFRLWDCSREPSPGAAVLVGRAGKVLLAKGYGCADVEAGRAITPLTRFRIGSVTKQFTAAAILKLQEKGKLKVTDALSKFFPDYPRGDEITIHHLLTHTSGIHSYTEKHGWVSKVVQPVEANDLIASFRDDPLDFEPGTKWHYSNSGYFLLGRIVEKESGLEYGEFLEREFFAPLGMKDTGVYRRGGAGEHEALGYSFEEGKVERAVDWDMSWAGGAGVLYSTVEDLFRWTEGIFGGRLLGEKSLEAMLEPVEVPDDAAATKAVGSGYGYGVIMSELRGLGCVSHGGGLHGFTSLLAWFPGEKLTVAVLANAMPPVPGLDPNRLMLELAEVYSWERMEPRKARSRDSNVDPTSYDKLIGRYDYGQFGILTITREGAKLYAQMSGQAPLEIIPRSPTTFYWKDVEAEVTFVLDAEGEVVEAVHKQGGGTIRARKLPELAEVELERAVLESYTGQYDYGSGAILTVTREGSRLFAQLTGQPKAEIFPSSETEFHWKVVAAKVTFVRDENGKVTKAVHEQGGLRFEAPKRN